MSDEITYYDDTGAEITAQEIQAALTSLAAGLRHRDRTDLLDVPSADPRFLSKTLEGGTLELFRAWDERILARVDYEAGQRVKATREILGLD